MISLLIQMQISDNINFMVTPCISNIQHFNFQLTHTTLLIFKCFSYSVFFNIVCVSWKLKC